MIQLDNTTGRDMLVACALATAFLNYLNAWHCAHAMRDCDACTGRRHLAATFDQHAVTIDDQLAEGSRRAARAPVQAAPPSAKPDHDSPPAHIKAKPGTPRLHSVTTGAD